MGSIKPILFEMSKQFPGSRVLEGRPGIDPHAIAIPKGRDLGVAYARKFIEDAKSAGLVKAAIDRAGLRAVTRYRRKSGVGQGSAGDAVPLKNVEALDHACTPIR
jgi:hypothetical protein